MEALKKKLNKISEELQSAEKKKEEVEAKLTSMEGNTALTMQTDVEIKVKQLNYKGKIHDKSDL
jgi:hypothetical protein